MNVYGTNLLDLCRALFRSEILEDVKNLLKKLGYHPRMDIDRIHLKDDGYCSCVWSTQLGGFDAQTLASNGLIIQRRKIHQLRK